MNSISIYNYKNFKHLEISDIGNVNLVVGKNNAGKSSLLEAISVLASDASVEWLKTLLELRGINSRVEYSGNSDNYELENFCSFYHNRDCGAFRTDPIRITATDAANDNSKDIEMKIVDIVEIVETDKDGSEIRRRVVYDPENAEIIVDGDISQALMVSINGVKSILSFGYIKRRYGANAQDKPFEYVRTAEFTGDRNPRLFDNVALTPLEPMLIEALHIIDDRIEAINFLKDDTTPRFIQSKKNDDNRVPFVVLNGESEKYRLSTMGDGINRILTIILSALNCCNGILLIDEFENGLHYSVQEGLWSLIYRLSQKLNIQVFATTHSEDCIKSFLRATKNSGTSRLIRLESTDSDVEAVIYRDADELDYITNNDIETR